MGATWRSKQAYFLGTEWGRLCDESRPTFWGRSGRDLATKAGLLNGDGVGATWRRKQAYLMGTEWERLGEVSRLTF